MQFAAGGSNLGDPIAARFVGMSSLEDDGFGDELTVISGNLSRAPKSSLTRTARPELGQLDPPERLEAFLDAGSIVSMISWRSWGFFGSYTASAAANASSSVLRVASPVAPVRAVAQVEMLDEERPRVPISHGLS